MKKVAIISSLILINLISLPLMAKERSIKINGTVAKNTSSIIVSVEGVAYLGENDTPNQARINALAQAKRNAAESALTKITSNTTVKDFVVTDDIITAKANADVIILEQENLPTINNEYKVKIKAEVRINETAEKETKKEVIDSDKSLKILAWTEKKEYKKGEKLSFTILTNKDSFVIVKYLTSTGENIQIFPNEYWKDNFIKAGEEITIPSKKISNFDFEVTEPFGKENLIVYASSSKIDTQKTKEESKRGIKIVNKLGYEEFSESSIEITTINK